MDWIFFDVGDTLVDESFPIEDSINQFVEQARRRGYGFGSEEVRQAVMDAHRRFVSFPMRDVMEQLIPTEEERSIIRSGMKYRKELEQPFPDAKPLLERLSAVCRIGVIANQSVGTAGRLETYGMLPYISAVFSSAEAGLSKPDPRFYELALRETQCLPSKAVMVGDRIDNDIIPAKEVGMHTIWVKQGFARLQESPGAKAMPDLTLDRLAEMNRLI